jgi:hypothetical protein
LGLDVAEQKKKENSPPQQLARLAPIPSVMDGSAPPPPLLPPVRDGSTVTAASHLLHRLQLVGPQPRRALASHSIAVRAPRGGRQRRAPSGRRRRAKTAERVKEEQGLELATGATWRTTRPSSTWSSRCPATRAPRPTRRRSGWIQLRRRRRRCSVRRPGSMCCF